MIETNIDFEELIEQRDWNTLRRELKEMEPLDIAEIIEELSEKEDIILFRLLSREEAKNTFQHLSHDKQEQIVEGLAKNANRLSALLNDLEPDDRT